MTQLAYAGIAFLVFFGLALAFSAFGLWWMGDDGK